MFLLLLITFLGVLLLSVIVFGGGQIFMPLFKMLWELMDKKGAHISEETINNIFAIANSTPGVVSTKFSFFTGYLLSNGQWWGYIAMIFTYLIFALPSIFLILITTKMIKKTKQNKYLKNIIIFLRPIIIGILLSLSIQLLLGTMCPWISFNSFLNGYKLQVISSHKTLFFSSWRMWALIFWVPFAILFSLFLMKKKVPLLLIIISFIIISFVLFQPWL